MGGAGIDLAGIVTGALIDASIARRVFASNRSSLAERAADELPMAPGQGTSTNSESQSKSSKVIVAPRCVNLRATILHPSSDRIIVSPLYIPRDIPSSE